MHSLATLRQLLVRPTVPTLGLLAVILAACGEFDATRWTLLGTILAFLGFFLWFTFIWIFISIFRDILTRDDLSGGGKALWVLVLVVLPFLGALVYLIARPKVTAGDVERLTRTEAAINAAAGVTVADQIAKLSELRAAGAISEEEYASLKAKVIG